MADGFETMVDAAQGFFTELAQTNEKAWFAPQKDRYTETIKKPAELFAELVAEDLSRNFDIALVPKVFRIYRDVRFSKDKTPYNTHLHMLWSAGQPTTPAIFFAVEPGSLWLGMGVFGFKGEMLTRWRAFIDRDGDAVRAELDRLAALRGVTISDFGAAPLKNVPKPYDPDHPHGALLRRKGLALGAELPRDWRTRGLVKSVVAMADDFRPLWHQLTDGI